MTKEQQELFINSQYDSLVRYQHKRNANIFFNIIEAKVEFGLQDYRQSLYLDVKKFIQAYITAADNLDYGYDELRNDKIFSVIQHLEQKQQLSILSQVRRMYYVRGYDQDDIYSKLCSVDISVSWAECNYKRAIRLWLSASLIRLLCLYLSYVIIVGLVLLPAPVKMMELFNVIFKTYSTSKFWNHIANTLALITGNESLSPIVEAQSVTGVILYAIGLVLFYVLFANFVLKKIEDYIALK